MFDNATLFNQSIRKWDVEKVDDMSRMFFKASAFNQPIGNWNVANVKSMAEMFANATSFNQDLSQWCVSRFNSQPFGFDDNTPAWEEKNKPVWGSCPRGEDRKRLKK